MGQSEPRGPDRHRDTLTCKTPHCKDPALYWVFLGCTEQFHTTETPACLSHMIEVRAQWFDDRDGRDLWCMECYRGNGYSGKLVTIDAILVTDLTGQATEEHSRGGKEEWAASSAPPG